MLENHTEGSAGHQETWQNLIAVYLGCSQCAFLWRIGLANASTENAGPNNSSWPPNYIYIYTTKTGITDEMCMIITFDISPSPKLYILVIIFT